MFQENAKIIGEMYEAAAGGDLERALTALDADVLVYEQESLPYGGIYRGHEGFQELFQKLAAHWDDFRFAVRELLDAGDAVIAVVQLNGKSRRSGAMLDMTMYEIWRMRDGKAVECRSIVWDTAKMLEILGN